jgi:putative chitinase
MVTAPLLAQIMQCPLVRAERWNPALTEAMREFGINSKRRAAHFYAQIGHESLSLSRVEEDLHYRTVDQVLKLFKKFDLNGNRKIEAEERAFAMGYLRNPEKLANFVYAGRGGNGPVASGDGYLYRGRGPIQTSLKDNYAATGKTLGLPLVQKPDLLLDVVVGARAAAAYWRTNNLNALADDNNTLGLSKKLNLGSATSKATPAGLPDRIARTNRALSLLGA